MNFKKYFVSKFIYILPIEDTFFFQVKFDKKIKFTDELIALNYKKYAPYKNPFFTTLMEEKNLFIWFYEKEIKAKFILPEAYLLSEFFKEKNPNILLSIEYDEGYIILIIKDTLLVNSYTLFDEDVTLIGMEMNKYSLDVFKKINKEEYFKSKEEALLKIGFKELYKWNRLNIDNTDMFPNAINHMAYPLSFLLFFMMSVELYHLNEVEKKLIVTETNYSKAKNKNNDIRAKINFENEKEQRWIDFVHRELPYIDSLSLFTDISKAFNDKAFVFKGFSIIGSRVKVDVTTKEDFIIGLKELNKIKNLKNVILKYSNKKRQTASYEATILMQGLSL